MTEIEKRLVNAYAVLVMAERRSLNDVPNTEIEKEDGSKTTLRKEVEIEIAEREIKIITNE